VLQIASQELRQHVGRVDRRTLASRDIQPKAGYHEKLRFNWNTPFFISPHAPSTVYIGANRVLRSTNRGDDFLPISPDLSTHDIAKVRWSMDSTGGITNDATGAETYGTITTLAESFRRSLRAQNKSPRTVEGYLNGVRLFDLYLQRMGMPRTAAHIHREHVESFVAQQVEQHKANTAATRYRALQQFFRWLNEEGELQSSPMANMRPPAIPDAPPPIGWLLRPEIARAMPTVSPDGRTYQFTIRPGYRFSPPSNQPVTADTFRYSIERALSPTMGNVLPGSGVIVDITGSGDKAEARVRFRDVGEKALLVSVHPADQPTRPGRSRRTRWPVRARSR